jgi:hypothetical protein
LVVDAVALLRADLDRVLVYLRGHGSAGSRKVC